MEVYRPRGRVWTAAVATAPVVSLSDMKAQLNVFHADDDNRIVAIEAAAVAMIEKYLQRLLTIRQVTLRLPGLPIGKLPVELAGGRIASLTSVVAEGATLSGATVIGESPALMYPANDWPTVTGHGLPVIITYTAGFATVPADIVTAVKLAGEALFDNADGGPMTAAVISLLDRHRIKAL